MSCHYTDEEIYQLCHWPCQGEVPLCNCYCLSQLQLTCGVTHIGVMLSTQVHSLIMLWNESGVWWTFHSHFCKDHFFLLWVISANHNVRIKVICNDADKGRYLCLSFLRHFSEIINLTNSIV